METMPSVPVKENIPFTVSNKRILMASYTSQPFGAGSLLSEEQRPIARKKRSFCAALMRGKLVPIGHPKKKPDDGMMTLP